MMSAERTSPVDAERGCFPRTLLSLREATVIADVPESRVRKDMETGVLVAPTVRRLGDARIWTSWIEVFTLAAVYGNATLNNELRKVALTTIGAWRELNKHNLFISYNHADQHLVFNCKASARHSFRNLTSLKLDKYLVLDYRKVFATVEPRLALYAYGLERIEEDTNILNGLAVFKGSRLSVRHVGKLYERHGCLDEILEDYPYLTAKDVEFAKLYHCAHPAVGRPRTAVEALARDDL